MPPKAQEKDKLTEKPVNPPENSRPRHRTSFPTRSAIRPGSDAGMYPLPFKPLSSKRTSSNQPLSRPKPSSHLPDSYLPRPHSPRPEAARASAKPEKPNEKRSPGGRRAVSQPEAVPVANRAQSQEATSPRPVRHSGGVLSQKSQRRIDNINQLTENVNKKPASQGYGKSLTSQPPPPHSFPPI